MGKSAKPAYLLAVLTRQSSGASGLVYADKVVIGAVTATSQAVEAATSASTGFLNRKNVDGLVGLGFRSGNRVLPVQQKTFFETVKPSLNAPVFAVSLKDRAPGTYDFGFLDAKKYSTPLVWVAADSSKGYWAFSATGYAVGSSASPTTTATINGVVDTGTALIYVDPTILAAYYSKIPGATLNTKAGGYIFPCSATPPDFSIVVGGAKQTVAGKYVNFSPSSQGLNMCFGGIQSNAGLSISIFGDVFLKSMYVAFMNSASGPSLGFAKQA